MAIAGVPLLEVVTEPDLRSGAEAAAYGAELRKVVTFLGISNGNMQVESLCSHTQLHCDESAPPTYIGNCCTDQAQARLLLMSTLLCVGLLIFMKKA